MKNKPILILSALIIVVMVVVSFFYPSVDENETAGTIGKVNKYRNSTVAEKNIVLRNAILQDTAALAYTIKTLEFYENYLGGLSKEFVTWESDINKLETNNPKITNYLGELDLLTQFMHNNLSTVASTRELLTKYYVKDTTEITIDIENNLIQFNDFVTTLSEKDKVLDSLFVALDGMIDKSDLEILKDAKGQTEELVTIREKILGTLAFHALMMGNESRLNMTLGTIVIHAGVLNNQFNSTLNFIIPAKSNNAKFGKDQLNNGMFSKEAALGFWGKEDAANAKNSASLENIKMSAQLQGIYLGKELGAVLAQDKLGFFAKPDGNYAVIESKEKLGPMLGKESLGPIWSRENLGPASNTFARSLGPIGRFARTLGPKTGQFARTVGSKDALGPAAW